MPINSFAKHTGLLSFSNIKFERFIHSVKTAIACIIGIIIVKTVGLPMDQWLLITIVVVMCAQINVGSVITKSYMRFLGTLSGSLLAAVTVSLFGSNTLVTLIVISLSAMFFSFIATSEKSYSDSGTLGAVTVIVIIMGQHPSIQSAAHRFLEISVGILIAALVSQFILPIRARDHMRRTQALTLKQFRDYYVFTLMTPPSDEVVLKYRDLDEEIVKTFSAQRSLAKEAAHEPFGAAFDHHQFNGILRCEKEVFRSVVCMHFAYDIPASVRDMLTNLPAVREFHQQMCFAFENIAHCTQQTDFTHTTVTIPSLFPIKEALQNINGQISSDDLVYVNGFLFCAEILIVHLTELVILLSQGRALLQEDHH